MKILIERGYPFSSAAERAIVGGQIEASPLSGLNGADALECFSSRDTERARQVRGDPSRDADHSRYVQLLSKAVDLE